MSKQNETSPAQIKTFHSVSIILILPSYDLILLHNYLIVQLSYKGSY